VHRGLHFLSEASTDAYEAVRGKVAHFIGAASGDEIVLTAGATMSINMIAHCWALPRLQAGDEILISIAEHHANIVPWQMLCQRTGAQLKVIPMTEQGTLDLGSFERLLSAKTRLVFVNHVSNALGTINPIEEIITKAHAVQAEVLIDGAQACPHLKPDVQALEVDYYVASAHKLCGPTGVGMLYGKEALLTKLPPYQGGGEMIATVTFEKTTYAALPHKFEAGTPNIAGGIAFGAALDYMNAIGFDAIAAYEASLLDYATQALKKIPGLKIYGETIEKTAVLSFNIEGLHPYDVGSILDHMGIAVRTGHHCAQPIMDFFQIPGTIRASFSFYNTKEEIDQLVKGLEKAISMLQ